MRESNVLIHRRHFAYAICAVLVGIVVATGCNKAETGVKSASDGVGANAPVAVPANVQKHAEAARASAAKEAEGAAIQAAQQNKK